MLGILSKLVGLFILTVLASACSSGEQGVSPGGHADSELIAHDRSVAAIIPCGAGVFEYVPSDAHSEYIFSLQDGTQILVSLAHRVGFARLSAHLGFGTDGSWLQNQFEPQSYNLKNDANARVRSSAYLLGQSARQYCIEHPFDTLSDVIDKLDSQLRAKKRAN